MAVQYSRETVEAAIASSCAMMGVAELKEKQKDAMKSFVEGNDVLSSSFCQLDTGSPCALLSYHWCLTTCVEKRIRLSLFVYRR